MIMEKDFRERDYSTTVEKASENITGEQLPTRPGKEEDMEN